MKRTLRYVILSILFICFMNSCSKSENTSTKKENTVIEHKDDYKSSEQNYIIFVSIGLNILSLILVFYLLKKQRKFERNVVEIVCNNEKIRSHIMSCYSRNSVDSKPQDHAKLSEQDKREIQELLQLDIKESVKEELSKTKNATTSPIISSTDSVENKSFLYASSANKASNNFYTVLDKLNGDTIYKLIIDSSNRDKAFFEVYEEAFSKIIQAPDFLEGASELQVLGSQKIVTEKQGIAERQADGKWRILEKAQIKII